MAELVGFLLIFLGGPLLVAWLAALVLQIQLASWSVTRKAWIAAAIGSLPALALAAFLIFRARSDTCDHSQYVCDSPVGAIGFMIFVLAVAVLPFSAIVARKVVGSSK
jgi:hypothetical protein